jgi:ABC-type lipoprotein export system ATPase subunit
VEIYETRGLQRSYGSVEAPVQALRGVNLKIHKGELVAIIGRSGSGKSTLLHLLAGIDLPTAGQILLEGKDLAAMNDYERTLLRRTRIGFIFQAYYLLPNLTAEENVAMPLRLGGTPKAEALRRAADKLERVGLGSRRTHLPSKMSGGEQQRTAIARALIIEPLVLLADEPTGNLDSENAASVLALILSLARERRTTVVLVTHDLDLTRSASRVIRLSDGRVEPGGPGGP